MELIQQEPPQQAQRCELTVCLEPLCSPSPDCSPEHCTAVSKPGDGQVQQLSEEVQELRKQVQQMPQLDVLQERLGTLAHQVQAVGASSSDAAAVLELRLQEVLATRESSGTQAGHADAGPCAEEGEDWHTMVTEQLASECSELQRRYNALQELVDGRIMISLDAMERQLPEALDKVERLLAEQNERFAKVEENDVRLNVALTKLGGCEQKVRDCMSRLDQVPSTSQARALWQEELSKLMENINVDGATLSKRIDMTLDAIEQIHQEQQSQAHGLHSLAKRLDEDETCGTYEFNAMKLADEIPV